MAQQTAVEWLEKQFDKYTSGGVNVPNNKIFKLTEKAKAMEKEQHGKTWDKALDAYESRGHLYVRAWSDFDEYYNETYNK